MLNYSPDDVIPNGLSQRIPPPLRHFRHEHTRNRKIFVSNLERGIFPRKMDRVSTGQKKLSWWQGVGNRIATSIFRYWTAEFLPSVHPSIQSKRSDTSNCAGVGRCRPVDSRFEVVGGKGGREWKKRLACCHENRVLAWRPITRSQARRDGHRNNSSARKREDDFEKFENIETRSHFEGRGRVEGWRNSREQEEEEEVKKVCQCVERGGMEGRRVGWNTFALWLLRLISFDHATIIISMVVEVGKMEEERERERERDAKRLTSDSSLIDRNDRVTSWRAPDWSTWIRRWMTMDFATAGGRFKYI